MREAPSHRNIRALAEVLIAAQRAYDDAVAPYENATLPWAVERPLLRALDNAKIAYAEATEPTAIIALLDAFQDVSDRATMANVDSNEHKVAVGDAYLSQWMHDGKPTKVTTVPCPACKGSTQVFADVPTGDAERLMPCMTCKATGRTGPAGGGSDV